MRKDGKFMEKAKSGIAYVVLIHVNVAFVPDASLVSSQDTAASQVERFKSISPLHISLLPSQATSTSITRRKQVTLAIKPSQFLPTEAGALCRSFHVFEPC